MKITIVGAGNMARGIATRAVSGGNQVELLDRNPEDAAALAAEIGTGATPGQQISGDIVVFALPYEAMRDAIDQHRAGLAGKIVVDITNPADWSTMDRLVTPVETSSAEQTARHVPAGTPVVKAFNTTFAQTLVTGEVAGETLQVLIAGDDAEAKKKVASLVEAGGMIAIDVGDLKRARQLEQVGLFHMAIQDQIGAGFASALKIHW